MPRSTSAEFTRGGRKEFLKEILENTLKKLLESLMELKYTLIKKNKTSGSDKSLHEHLEEVP